MIEQFYLIHRWDPNRMDLGVMKMKRYSTLSRELELEPHHQMQFSIIHRTPLFGGRERIQRYYTNRCIIQKLLHFSIYYICLIMFLTLAYWFHIQWKKRSTCSTGKLVISEGKITGKLNCKYFSIFLVKICSDYPDVVFFIKFCPFYMQTEFYFFTDLLLWLTGIFYACKFHLKIYQQWMYTWKYKENSDGFFYNAKLEIWI